MRLEAAMSLPTSATALTFGEELAAVFDQLREWTSPAARVFNAVAAKLDLPAHDAVLVTGRLLARHVDAAALRAPVHPYHNVHHFCEVMIGVSCLARRAGMQARETSHLVLAALMHDIGHDGQPNGEQPFRLERKALRLTMPWLALGGIAAGERARLATLVLATEPAYGYPHAVACHAWHLAGDALVPPPEPPLDAPELQTLAIDRQLCRQALALCEADVLPSVGLTVAHSMRLQAALADEWGTVLDPADKLRFIAQWRRRAVLSRFVEPNVDELSLWLRGGLPSDRLESPGLVDAPDSRMDLA